jgi:ribosomal protein S18 acetylase RimI-like enzyme
MMELVYIGLSPAARGVGLGDYLVRLAMAKTAQSGLRVLTLAVDSVNTPAIRLYHRHGLSEVQRRHAMIKDLRHPENVTRTHAK